MMPWDDDDDQDDDQDDEVGEAANDVEIDGTADEPSTPKEG